MDGVRASARWRGAARADPAKTRRGALPPLRQLRRRRHAQVRRRHRGARHPAPARRRQGVSRPRGSRDRSRGARGDRVARRRAVGVRDAEGVALRDRRRGAARVSPSISSGAVSSVQSPEGVGRQLGRGPRAERRAGRAPDADRRRASPAAAAPSRAELSSGRGDDWPSAHRDARARRLHPAAGGRAGARQRAARRRARAAVRGERRHLVPRLHRRAARRRVGGGGRSADSRRGQRRCAPDDGAQSQRARVPHRHPRGPHLPHEPQRREPVPGRVAQSVRDEDRRMGAARAPRSRGRRSRARSGRRDPARVRRRHARARSARRPGARR